jgi:hypothetical protein
LSAYPSRHVEQCQSFSPSMPPRGISKRDGAQYLPRGMRSEPPATQAPSWHNPSTSRRRPGGRRGPGLEGESLHAPESSAAPGACAGAGGISSCHVSLSLSCF